VAEALGDQRTATLARNIQQEEEATARKIWAMIPITATESVAHVVNAMSRS